MELNKQSLDNWITGNYGEDQFKDDFLRPDDNSSDDLNELKHCFSEVSSAIDNLVGTLEDIGFRRGKVNQEVVDLSNKVDSCGMEIVSLVYDFLMKEKEKK